jgi:cell wall-associated NlpC family hydrolase
MTDTQRAQIVKIAESWLRTPYRGHSAVKGPKGGTDCAQLLAACYQEAGLIPKDIVLPKDYPLHIGANRASTQYVDEVLKFFVEIKESELKPGDLIIWKLVHSLAFCHGAINVSWPDCFVHAYGDTVKMGSARHRIVFNKSEKRYFTLKDGADGR